jgi:hypothetical protein
MFFSPGATGAEADIPRQDTPGKEGLPPCGGNNTYNLCVNALTVAFCIKGSQPNHTGWIYRYIKLSLFLVLEFTYSTRLKALSCPDNHSPPPSREKPSLPFLSLYLPLWHYFTIPTSISLLSLSFIFFPSIFLLSYFLFPRQMTAEIPTPSRGG